MRVKHLKNRIKKLHLERGDVIVCRDSRTMKDLGNLSVEGLEFPVPILFAPEGLEKVSFDELDNVMKVAQQAMHPRLIIPGATHAAQSK